MPRASNDAFLWMWKYHDMVERQRRADFAPLEQRASEAQRVLDNPASTSAETEEAKLRQRDAWDALAKLWASPAIKGRTKRLARAEHREFTYTGELWCHLGDYVRTHEVISRCNGWVLVDTRTYEKAIGRATAKLRAEGYLRSGIPSAELLEVFIEARPFRRHAH